MKNKKSNTKYNAIIIVIIILIVLIAGYFFYDASFNVTFKLNQEEITIYQGESYNSSFEAYDSSGNDISDKVTIDDKVDVNRPGEYQKCFTLKNGLYTKTLCQKIIVKENVALHYEIRLNGEATVYVLKGHPYNDVGAKVYDGSNEVNINISKTGTVDTSKVGEYELTYTFYSNNVQKSIKRKVVVYDLLYTISYSPKTDTSGTVKINFTTSSEYYSHTILPNSREDRSNNISYEVNDNGEYKFVIYDKNNYSKEETITINNIKREYKCSGVIDRKGTTLKVTGKGLDYIKNYQYNLSGQTYKGNSTYNIYKVIKKASVKLTLNSGSTLDINCTVTDKRIYNFKYDAENKKPYMKCNTYTAQDKIKYDKILSAAINEAGYGSRAGVVEAARYLTGGLDYKVRYLGPKKVNSALGRYKRKGLNIGQSGAWGCSVSGWTQGMDCTNFVEWCFAQNGLDIKGGVYGTSNTYNTVDVKDKIKAGDFLLAPAPRNSGKTFSHITIVVGVNDKAIWVAEATTGTVNAIVISKLDKSKLSSYGVKVARLYPYEKEGNYTAMWLE